MTGLKATGVRRRVGVRPGGCRMDRRVSLYVRCRASVKRFAATMEPPT